MKNETGGTRRWLEAIGFGAVAGVRTLTAPAIVARRLVASGARPGRDGNLARNLLSSRAVATGLRWAAMLEMAVDKTPFLPRSVRLAPLIGRATVGGIAAAAWSDARKPPAIAAAALLGAAAAVGAAYGAQDVRRRVARAGGGRGGNLARGLVEDLVALAIATVAGRSLGVAAGGKLQRGLRGLFRPRDTRVIH